MSRRFKTSGSLVALTGALCLSAAWGAGPKTSGTSQIVDDLPIGTAGTVRATVGVSELDGGLGQVSEIIAENLTPGATVEAGYFSRLVSTPATANYNQTFGSSVSFSWTDAAVPNPSGTAYVIDMSTDPTSAGTLSTASAYGFSGGVTGLRGNTTYYSRIHASYTEGDDSGFYTLGKTITQAVTPASGLVYDNSPFVLKALWDPFSDSGGSLIAPWAVSSSALPNTLQGHAMVLYGGRLYVSGGVSSAATTAVWTAPILSDGSVGTWTATTPLPAPRESHAMTAWNGRLYVLGGTDGSVRSTVWWAPILSDGTLGSWSATTSLPAARTKLTAGAWGRRLYALGGDNGVFPQANVYYADIRDDGSLGAWSTGSSLPQGISGHAMAISSGTIYVSGGVSGFIGNAVWWSALIGGVPLGWNYTSPLPISLTRHSMSAANGKLYVCGGNDGFNAQTSVWVGEINPDQTVASWQAGSGLPGGRFLHAAATSGDILYLVGGADDSSAVSSIVSVPVFGTQYLAERATDSGFTTAYSSSGWRPGTTYDFAAMTPNTPYFTRVRTRNFAGVETASLALASTVTLAAIPVSAASTFTSVQLTSITLQWNAGANPAGTEFRAQLSTSADFGGAVFTSNWLTAVSTAVVGLAINTSYYARVEARNSQLIETPFALLGATYTLAATPAGSTISSSTASGLTLNWGAGGNPLGGTYYEAQVATGTNFATIVQSTVTPSFNVVFTGLISASTFYARVRALNGNGVASAFDATVSTATGLDAIAPGVATGTFAVQGSAADSINVGWVTPGDDAYVGTLLAGARFFVQWSTMPPASVTWSTASAQVVVSTGPLTPGSQAGVTITGLPDQKTVYFTVWTQDQSGNYSAASALAAAYASPFTTETLEGGGGFDAGSSPSLAVAKNSDLRAAYQGITGSQELRYVAQTAGVWGAAQAVDPGTIVSDVTLALDDSDNPQIFYRDTGTPQLKLASFNGSSWTLGTLETGNFRAGGLVVDAAGNARVSYYDGAAGHLKFGLWTGSSWSTQTVDNTAADTGRESALALDAAQQAHIAYYDATNSVLKYASSTLAGTWSLQTVDASVGVGTACVIALDGFGRAHIAYGDIANHDVKYASWTGTGWNVRVVESVGNIGGLRLGLALDGAGNPQISYSDRGTGDLKFARWTGSAFSTQTVASAGDQGLESSLAVDGGGALHIGYRDSSDRTFAVAHWSAASLPLPLGGNPRSRLQAPSGLSSAVVSATSIQWSWTDSATNELGYSLYGAVSSTGPFALIADTVTIGGASGTGVPKTYVETGLTQGTTYYRYAVTVGSGGAVASALVAAYPYNNGDTTSPTYVNNQTGDPTWRRVSGTLYDVDFFDAGGSHLSKIQVKASTVPAGAGPDLIAFTDAVININADSYTQDWPLAPAVFNAMIEGVTNYVTVKVIDGGGNSATLVDAFYVKKDSTAPNFVNNQALDTIPHMTAPPPADVDVFDAVSGLAGFQYSVSTKTASADASAIGWTDIALLSNTTSYKTNWSVNFSGLISGYANYVSVRSWDVAGSTRVLTDAFQIIRVSAGPTVAVTSPASTYASSLNTVSGTALDVFGVQGVEVSFQDSPPTGLYWSGVAFNSAAPVWFTATGTATWSYTTSIPWVDQGLYAVIARSSDTGGNYSAVYATSTFTIDLTSPTVSVGTPTANSTISALPAITGTAADAASGVGSVELMLRRNTDGLWWNFFTNAWSSVLVSTAATGTTSWTFAPSAVLQANLASGTSYYIAARALDKAVPANAGDFFSPGSSTFTFSDTTPPAAVADLAAVSGTSPGEINLSWTSPGDDGSSGIIASGQFLIQYATFTPATYSTAAAQVIIPIAMVSASSAQARVLTGLSGGATYYFAMWTQDDAGNWSSLSNGATALATPTPSNQISGHVVEVSSQGITAVEVDCWDSSGTLKSTAFTQADGSGTYVLNGVPQGSDFKIQATWSVNGVASSVWIDGISVGVANLDFVLQLNYNLATLTGSLQTLSSGPTALGVRAPGTGIGAAAFFDPKGVPNPTQARVELYQRNRQVGMVPVGGSGQWRIPNLLPGRYQVRAYNGFDYTDFQTVDLVEGETRILTFVYDPLPKERVFAFPNPAQRSTTFRFETSLSPLEAQIAIFDIAGNRIKEIPGSMISSPSAGVYHADWDLTNDRGQAVASGVYLFTVKVKGGAEQTAQVIKKLAVVR